MQDNNIEDALYQILSGIFYFYYDELEFISVPNTIEEKRRASILYNKIMNDLNYEEMLTWNQVQQINRNLGYWTDKDETSLKGLEKFLENLKVDIYKSHMRDDLCDPIRKQIKKINDSIYKSMSNKYKFYETTKEYYADSLKRQYLVAMSIRDMNYNKIFHHHNFFIDKNSNLIQSMINYIDSQKVDQKVIRKLSRSEPWRSMWILGKPNVFDKPSSLWTDEQRLLASYSRMYDNVYESLECPIDKVIEDDDMLDGWFILQRRERENKQNENNTTKMFNLKNKHGDQEVFLVANNLQQAQNIYNMNDEQSRSIVKSREQVIKSLGEVDHGHLPDVQNDLRMQATRQFQNKMRK